MADVECRFLLRFTFILIMIEEPYNAGLLVSVSVCLYRKVLPLEQFNGLEPNLV